MPRLRNFDTEPPSSYCYEFRSDNRLESVANAHTAADLHVRPRFSNRADLESRGRRERLKKYTMGNFPQSFDSMFAMSLRRCCCAAIALFESQVFESPQRIARCGFVINLLDRS
jgi:hypothetical protein